MLKKSTVYIVIAVLTIGILMLLQYNKPKKINWFESYVATHKIPYGTFVLNELVPKLFPGKVQQIQLPPFEFLGKNDSIKGAYLFINNRVSFEESELKKILEWTAKGNITFIASKSFEAKLLDTLHLGVANIYSGFETNQKQEHFLVNPNLKLQDSILFEKSTQATYFSEIDTLNTILLARVSTSSEGGGKQNYKNFNVIRQPFGNGEIILSTFPEAFTNYFILKKDNKQYTAGLLSYFSDADQIYLDNHYKSGKSFYTSPMYIFLNTKELKWAYYIALIGAFVYILFEGKRKQRAIPVVVPLKNQTLAFTRTISDMYFEKSDQKNIAEHKINFFLHKIRSTYYLGTITKEDEFYKNLASRSGHSFEWVKSLFIFIEEIRNSTEITDSQLIKLNNLIQKFKSGAHGA
ncbi:DUF4350 domain-containing protein [Maribacter sp. 2210JD10-5]|uniref:DUF4350 domain-containing protein n=1 Tax=Maribacter sp. 2210JD10-5 TaxID=3386272 RepID=UPI0039BC5762